MPDALTSETMSLRLLKVVERAKTEPEGRFHSLAHRNLSTSLRHGSEEFTDPLPPLRRWGLGSHICGVLRPRPPRLQARTQNHRPAC
jgi:hypothetical protein